MQGARKYVTAIESLARAGGYGFEEFEDSIKFIRKGNFVFECDYHARGKTLHIYLLKDMPPLDADEKLLRKKVYSSENALEVYGVISGQLGWSETYGYLVNNEIKHILSQIFIDAVRDYNDFLNNKKTKIEEKEADVKTAYAQKVKEFEEFLLESCKETTSKNASSKSGKTLEFTSKNPVQNAYDILLNVQNNSDADIDDYSIAVEDAIGYLGQALDESDTEDENIITLEMIKEGLKQGLIVPKLEDDGLKCYIGEDWFYIGGSEFEKTDPKDIPEDIISKEIFSVLESSFGNYFADEYTKFCEFLIENFSKGGNQE